MMERHYYSQGMTQCHTAIPYQASGVLLTVGRMENHMEHETETIIL